MNTSIFDTLLQLPLFQGLTKEDFTNIVGKVKFHFTQQRTGEVIVREVTPSEQLYFILKGEISVTTTSADGLYSFTEYIQAPYLIEPQSLFGLRTNYVSRYVAHSNINMVSISKAFVTNELFKYEIFRLNFLNMVSSYGQNQNDNLWSAVPGTLEERIYHFIRTHIRRRQGEKLFKIKMEDLAMIVNDTRTNVSRFLNDLQNNGFIELHRGEICIFEAEALLALSDIPQGTKSSL